MKSTRNPSLPGFPKAAVSRFPGAGVSAAATATAKVLRGGLTAPSSRRQAARVVRMWLGLFPGHARRLAKWICLKMLGIFPMKIGIMISKTIGFRGLAYFQTHPNVGAQFVFTFEGQEVMLMAIEYPIIGKNRFTDSGYLKLRVQEPKLGNMFRNEPWRFSQKEFGLPLRSSNFHGGPFERLMFLANHSGWSMWFHQAFTKILMSLDWFQGNLRNLKLADLMVKTMVSCRCS